MTYTLPVCDNSFNLQQSYDVELIGDETWSFADVRGYLAVTTYDHQDLLSTNLYWSLYEVASAVDVHEDESSDIVLYTGLATLHIPKSCHSFELYNLQGQRVFKGLVNSDLDHGVNGLSHGTFVVVYLDDQGVLVGQELVNIGR